MDIVHGGDLRSHPTRITWDAEVIEHVHNGPSFDPRGILVVAERDDPARFVAFTRVETEPEGDGLLGEVGLIGVLPAWRGRGLGRELLRWGIAELRGRARCTDRPEGRRVPVHRDA